MDEANTELGRAQFKAWSVPQSYRDVFRPPVPITLYGVPGDHVFEVARQTGTFYEVDLLECVSHCVHRPLDLVVDVGAHIGNHALYFAKVLGASVVCVEPASQARAVLDRNLQANGVGDRVEVVPAAAGHAEKVVRLLEPSAGNTGTRRVDHDGSSERSNVVQMQTLDGILANVSTEFRSVSVIKIDVEGMELEVLSGATETIEAHSPMLMLELTTDRVFRSAQRLLASRGYRFLGPFGITPTYVFGVGLNRRPLRYLGYRLWRMYTRGRLRRLVGRISAVGS